MDMSTLIHEQIKLLALSLPIGATEHYVCPACNANHERSLYVTRKENVGLLYICFRSTCGIRGGISSRSVQQHNTAEKRHHKLRSDGAKRSKGKKYHGKLSNLGASEFRYLQQKYHINKDVDVVGWKRTDDSELYIPILDSYSRHIGDYVKVVWRGLESGESKVRHYFYAGFHAFHYPPPRQPANLETKNRSPYILVEDPISAVRVSAYGRGVALLGTHLKPEHVTALAQQTKYIVMALDPDANAKALQWKRKYGMFFDTFDVRFLSSDPKDLPSDQLQRELKL